MLGDWSHAREYLASHAVVFSGDLSLKTTARYCSEDQDTGITHKVQNSPILCKIEFTCEAISPLNKLNEFNECSLPFHLSPYCKLWSHLH